MINLRPKRSRRPPRRFQDEVFLKGAPTKVGEINGIDYDAYDKTYDFNDMQGCLNDIKFDIIADITDEITMDTTLDGFIVDDNYFSYDESDNESDNESQDESDDTSQDESDDQSQDESNEQFQDESD